jgi:hypothetical protein
VLTQFDDKIRWQESQELHLLESRNSQRNINVSVFVAEKHTLFYRVCEEAQCHVSEYGLRQQLAELVEVHAAICEPLVVEKQLDVLQQLIADFAVFDLFDDVVEVFEELDVLAGANVCNNCGDVSVKQVVNEYSYPDVERKEETFINGAHRDISDRKVRKRVDLEVLGVVVQNQWRNVIPNAWSRTHSIGLGRWNSCQPGEPMVRFKNRKSYHDSRKPVQSEVVVEYYFEHSEDV